jgi:hypothetical protein
MTGASVRRDPRALWRRTLDGAVLLPATQPEPLRLNASAAAVWRLLDGWVGADELAREVAELFGIDVDRATRDVTSTLQALTDVDALEVRASG